MSCSPASFFVSKQHNHNECLLKSCLSCPGGYFQSDPFAFSAQGSSGKPFLSTPSSPLSICPFFLCQLPFASQTFAFNLQLAVLLDHGRDYKVGNHSRGAQSATMNQTNGSSTSLLPSQIKVLSIESHWKTDQIQIVVFGTNRSIENGSQSKSSSLPSYDLTEPFANVITPKLLQREH